MNKLIPTAAFVIWMFFQPLYAQQANTRSDLYVINQHSQQKSHVHNRAFLFKESKNPIVKYNPATLVFGSLLYTYQNLISQQLSATCLYHPSCSEFGKHAIENFGFFMGTMLAADRITRCNRISALDIHPVRINDHSHKVFDTIELYK